MSIKKKGPKVRLKQPERVNISGEKEVFDAARAKVERVNADRPEGEKTSLSEVVMEFLKRWVKR